VLRVLYLVFNEGYSGDVDLAAEAIRLTRQLAAKTNHEEVAGLLALMPLHRARRPARPAPTAASCATEQDRSLWDTRLIAEGVDVLQAPSPATDWGSSRLCSPCCPVGPRPLPFKRPISRAPRHTRV
jgi:predicted RNA polymerase sigma factor